MKNEVSREQLIDAHPLVNVVQDAGIALSKKGPNELQGLCPFHKEKTPSFTITLDKQLFYCFGCHAAGSVIDFVAKISGRTTQDVYKDMVKEYMENNGIKPTKYKAVADFPDAPKPSTPVTEENIKATYSYRDRFGVEVYQVLRFEPKTFRQRHKVGENWVWNMDGVERVPYNLPKILKSGKDAVISYTEGEKDADTLWKMGFLSTATVGGAGKWIDGYNQYFKGRNIVVFQDNDEPGRKHAKMVLDSLSKVAKSTRHIIPPEPYKDVTEWVEGMTGTEEEKAHKLFELVEVAPVYTGGIVLPLKTMGEMEMIYTKFVKEVHTKTLDLSKWLPLFGQQIRGIVPGEVVTIIADTGVGKTLIAQNIVISAAPLNTLFFELELPDTLTFERFVSISEDIPAATVYHSYFAGQTVNWKASGRLSHIHVCNEAGVTPVTLEDYILKSELKTGEKPVLVVVDYIQLLRGIGKSRYERIADAAEAVKVIAKRTNTIVLITSQIHRKPEDAGNEVTLKDAKNAGEIENSSGLVLGAWRDKDNQKIIHIKVLKNTKGPSNIQTRCILNEESLSVKEAPFDS